MRLEHSDSFTQSGDTTSYICVSLIAFLCLLSWIVLLHLPRVTCASCNLRIAFLAVFSFCICQSIMTTICIIYLDLIDITLSHQTGNVLLISLITSYSVGHFFTILTFLNNVRCSISSYRPSNTCCTPLSIIFMMTYLITPIPLLSLCGTVIIPLYIPSHFHHFESATFSLWILFDLFTLIGTAYLYLDQLSHLHFLKYHHHELHRIIRCWWNMCWSLSCSFASILFIFRFSTNSLISYSVLSLHTTLSILCLIPSISSFLDDDDDDEDDNHRNLRIFGLSTMCDIGDDVCGCCHCCCCDLNAMRWTKHKSSKYRYNAARQRLSSHSIYGMNDDKEHDLELGTARCDKLVDSEDSDDSNDSDNDNHHCGHSDAERTELKEGLVQRQRSRTITSKNSIRGIHSHRKHREQTKELESTDAPTECGQLLDSGKDGKTVNALDLEHEQEVDEEQDSNHLKRKWHRLNARTFQVRPKGYYAAINKKRGGVAMVQSDHALYDVVDVMAFKVSGKGYKVDIRSLMERYQIESECGNDRVRELGIPWSVMVNVMAPDPFSPNMTGYQMTLFAKLSKLSVERMEREGMSEAMALWMQFVTGCNAQEMVGDAFRVMMRVNNLSEAKLPFMVKTLIKKGNGKTCALKRKASYRMDRENRCFVIDVNGYNGGKQFNSIWKKTQKTIGTVVFDIACFVGAREIGDYHEQILLCTRIDKWSLDNLQFVT